MNFIVIIKQEIKQRASKTHMLKVSLYRVKT